MEKRTKKKEGWVQIRNPRLKPSCLAAPESLDPFVSVALPAEPRGEKKLFFVQILGGEKLLKFGEKWAVKNF